MSRSQVCLDCGALNEDCLCILGPSDMRSRPHETDPHGIDVHTPGAKLDAGKLDLTLVPPSVATAMAKVMAYGAEKYTRGGWKSVPEPGLRYHAALLRHLSAYARGEDLDPDTQLPHLDHALCNLGFLVSLRDEHEIDIGDWRKL